MKRLLKDAIGGLLIAAAATTVGVLHNTVRGDSLPLIQDVEVVSTVQHGNGNGDDDAEAAGTSADLPDWAVSAEQVKEMMNQENVYIIDARAPEIFAQGRIAGAINVPYDRLPEYYDQLTAAVPLDATIVCYCWSPTCDFSDQLATELKIMGYSKVVVFTGGWEHWQEAGYPTEGTGDEG